MNTPRVVLAPTPETSRKLMNFIKEAELHLLI